MVAEKRWAACLYHANSKARRQVWHPKCLRAFSFLVCDVHCLKAELLQPLKRPGGQEKCKWWRCTYSSAFKLRESILGCLHLLMEHSLHVGTCSTRTYVHREVVCFFPFIYSLARRKVLQDKRVPGEQFCKWRYRIVCLFLLQNWKAKIWNSDIPRCTVHQRVKNRHVFITRQSLPLSFAQASCSNLTVSCQSQDAVWTEEGFLPAVGILALILQI